MRTLTIFRHAHAEKADDDLEDFERQLDKRGRREAKHMGARLAALELRPDHLVTSSATRTVQTAHILAHALGFPLERIRHDDRAYLAEAERLLAIVQHSPDEALHVLLVGHNPGLSALASRLDADRDVAELPTAANRTLRLPIRHWSDLAWRTGDCIHAAAPGDDEPADDAGG